MLTAYFDLNATDIFKMRLNDKIWIDNSWWNINKIIDYDVNAQALTKVELISADDYLDLPTFRTRRPIADPLPWADFATLPIYDTNTYHKNINLSPNVKILGKGNVVDQNLKGVLVGNDTTVNNNSELTLGGETDAEVFNPTPTYETITLPIGVWDMALNSNLTLPHGIADFTKIRSINIMILDDSGLALVPLYYSDPATGVLSGILLGSDSTSVYLARTDTGIFNTTDYDDTGINRGFVTITYEL
jgi:hypothetical protein